MPTNINSLIKSGTEIKDSITENKNDFNNNANLNKNLLVGSTQNAEQTEQLLNYQANSIIQKFIKFADEITTANAFFCFLNANLKDENQKDLLQQLQSNFKNLDFKIIAKDDQKTTLAKYFVNSLKQADFPTSIKILFIPFLIKFFNYKNNKTSFNSLYDKLISSALLENEDTTYYDRYFTHDAAFTAFLNGKDNLKNFNFSKKDFQILVEKFPLIPTSTAIATNNNDVKNNQNSMYNKNQAESATNENKAETAELVNDYNVKGNAQKVNLKMIIAEKTSNDAPNLNNNVATTTNQTFSLPNDPSEKAKFFFDNICTPYANFYTAENPHEYLKNNYLYIDISKFNFKVVNADIAKKHYRLTTYDNENLLVLLFEKNNNCNERIVFINSNGLIQTYGDDNNNYSILKKHRYEEESDNYIFENLLDLIIYDRCISFSENLIFAPTPYKITNDFNQNNDKYFISKESERFYNKENSIYFIGFNKANNIIEYYKNCYLELNDFKNVINKTSTAILDFLVKEAKKTLQEKNKGYATFAPLEKWNENNGDLIKAPTNFPLNNFPQLFIKTLKAVTNSQIAPAELTMQNLLATYAFSIQGNYNLKSYKEAPTYADGNMKTYSVGTLPLNLYMLNLSPSSDGKTSINKILSKGIDDALKYIHDFYKEQKSEYDSEIEILNATKKNLLDKIKKGDGENNNKEEIEAKIKEINLQLAKKKTPLLNALNIENTTTEKLVDDCNKTSKNVYLSSMEASAVFDNYNTLNNNTVFMATFADGWSGIIPEKSTKNDGRTEKTEARLTLNLAMQNDKFYDTVIKYEDKNNAITQGLIPRFIISCSQKINYKKSNDDCEFRKVEQQNHYDIVKYNNITFSNLTIKDNNGNLISFYNDENELDFKGGEFYFADNCLNYFNCLWNKYGSLKDNAGEVKRSFYNKVLENIQRVAGVFHHANEAINNYDCEIATINYDAFNYEIPLETLQKSAEVVDYYLQTALSLFDADTIQAKGDDEVKRKAELVVKNLMTKNYAQHHRDNGEINYAFLQGNCNLKDKQLRNNVISFLIRKGVLATDNIQRKGEFYLINPAVLEYSFKEFKIIFID